MKKKKELVDMLVDMMKMGVVKCMEMDNLVETMCFFVKGVDFTSVPAKGKAGELSMELFNKDKGSFYDAVSCITKAWDLDAVVFVSEAWLVKHDKKSKWDGKLPSQCDDRQDMAYFTVDTKGKQIIFVAEKLDHKVGKWEKVMDYDKTKPIKNVNMYGGMAIDFFRSGSILPMSNMELIGSAGDVKCDEKID